TTALARAEGLLPPADVTGALPDDASTPGATLGAVVLQELASTPFDDTPAARERRLHVLIAHAEAQARAATEAEWAGRMAAQAASATAAAAVAAAEGEAGVATFTADMEAAA